MFANPVKGSSFAKANPLQECFKDFELKIDILKTIM